MDTLQKMGQITFEFVGSPELLEVHVFRADHFNGEPKESDGRCYLSSSGGEAWAFSSETILLINKCRSIHTEFLLRREAAGL